MRKELDKVYDPQQVESRVYRFWLEGGFFHAEPNPEKKPFTIVIPPPNITGKLHMGHALDETVQDILIRAKRMQGYEALWMPGTDHASIATEAKIVEAMRKEGLTKEQIGREAFLQRAWAWRAEYGGAITEQLKKLGCSCDWARERFTLDEGCSRAVRKVFKDLYDQGLIYRGERIVNWCPHCLTSISDAEVEYEDQPGHFWHLRYPYADGSGWIEVATTRPETCLGDAAVAVNPGDERYQDAVGKTVILPLVGREIPVIADDYVDTAFGTGAVKITPAHDPNDFEVGLRHNLPFYNMLTPDAKITADYPAYAGLDRYAAREAVVKDLTEGGYLTAVEEHSHNVGTCYRCHTTIEPRVSKQWFVAMKKLAEPAVEAVKDGEIRFFPDRFSKNYFYWMENIRDWCISRQLWWGHRIPVWYCDDCEKQTVVADGEPSHCEHCGGAHIHQDPDTLDTWFSSALWPFSTLGWPDETPEYNYFYPTDVLVTGYDIITFWVSRMIFSGLNYTGKRPFRDVVIHGLVRDAEGRKMSKSLGNGIDPLEIIADYGADALRLALVTGISAGNDTRFTDEKVTACRNFANKLWNAARFVLMNLPEDYAETGLPEALALEDKWVLSQYNDLVRDVTANLENYDIGVAEQKVVDFIWDVYCSWYIELAKARLQEESSADGARKVLVYVLAGVLKLLHPFMPYITEEIWQALPHEGASIMVSAWPVWREELDFRAEAGDFTKVMEAIKAVRNRRSEMNVPPSKKASLFIETAFPEVFERGAPFFTRLASAAETGIVSGFDAQGSVLIVTDSAKIYIPMAELVDVAAELARLRKELAQCEGDAAGIAARLENPGFTEKAPERVVAGERDKLAKLRERIAKLHESVAALS
ncbi:MAG TPA: valine--tRNA ligase [Oscillospiraceae bacterium]|nr:valine--tRNA ligase [Oscillospiraceae bacterium]HNW05208.1 valine--tRNA ligase [Oscillospiraceae bacterium]